MPSIYLARAISPTLLALAVLAALPRVPVAAQQLAPARTAPPAARSAPIMPRDVQTTVSSAPTAPVASTSVGELRLRNVSWDSVRVEIRVGASADCAQDAMVAQVALKRGGRYALRTDQHVCWRREQDPVRRTGQWTAWMHHLPTGGAPVEQSLADGASP